MVLFAFFVFLLAQYHNIFLYYDDYGYASLSYGYDVGIVENSAIFPKLLDWLIHSYSSVNGRVFTNLIFVLTAQLGDVALMRIFFPICVTGIFCMIYSRTISAIKSEVQKTIGAILLVLSYGIFDIGICREGLYWFAAAFGYVVPMFLFFLFLKMRKGGVFQCLLAFLLCLSCEQMVAMMVFGGVTNLILFFWEKRKVDKADVKILFFSLLGGVIMVLSPASRNRLTAPENMDFYKLGLFEKVLWNINVIVEHLFSRQRIIFCIFLLLLLMFSSLILLKGGRGKIVKVVNAVYIFSCLLCILYCVSLYRGLMHIPSKYFCYILFLHLLSGFVNLNVLYFKLDQKMIPIITAGMASIGLLLIMPVIPLRTFIPIGFIIIFCMMDILGRLIADRNIGIPMVYIPAAFVMSINIFTIYRGYMQNVEVLSYNHSRLTEAGELSKNGVIIDEIILYKMKDDTYSGGQVYYTGIGYMKWWIDKYYAIPRGIEYVYYDWATRNNGISLWESGGNIERVNRASDREDEVGSTLRSCVKLQGYFEDGWLERSSKFLVNTKAEGKIYIGTYCPPDDIADKEVKVFINDILVETVRIQETSQMIQVSAEPNQIVQLGLETNWVIDSGEDQRELAMIISSIHSQ